MLGKNGAGKTSLIEVLVGFRWTDTGDLKIFGNSIRNKSREYLKNVSFLSHDVQLSGGQKISDFFILTLIHQSQFQHCRLGSKKRYKSLRPFQPIQN